MLINNLILTHPGQVVDSPKRIQMNLLIMEHMEVVPLNNLKDHHMDHSRGNWLTHLSL